METHNDQQDGKEGSCILELDSSDESVDELCMDRWI